MQNLAPIALFVYNRPEHTRRTLTYLQKNLLADESRLFIFSDAAKTEAEKDKVEEVRQLIKEVTGFKSVKIIESKKNLGLAKSVISGVTQLVNEYGKVIVFEDDLQSSAFTLIYLNEALDRYATEEKVMHIGAYMYDLKDHKLPQTFFSTIVTSWGWATWARAWKYFEDDIMRLLPHFENDKEKRNEFSFNDKMNFYTQLTEFRDKKNNSWAIRWYASVYLNHGLSLNPSKSLINNIGFDYSGTHTHNEKVYQVLPANEPVTQFPEVIGKNARAYKEMEKFLAKRKGDLFQRGFRYINKNRIIVVKMIRKFFDKPIN